MKQSYRLIYNSVVIVVARLLGLVPQLIILPFVLHRLEEEQYGIYALAWSLLSILYIVQPMMASAVTKYSSSYLAKGKISEINKVVTTASIYAAICGVLACFGIIIWTKVWAGSIKAISAQYFNESIFAFTCIAILIAIKLPMLPFRGLLQAQQRHDVTAIVNVGSQYLKLALVVTWFTIFAPSLKALMVISVSVMILSDLLIVIMSYLKTPGLKWSWSLNNWDTFCKLFFFGGVMILCALTQTIEKTGLRWTMGTIISASFVAHLSIILMANDLFVRFAHGMTMTIMPAASKYEAQRNWQVLRELLIRSTRYLFVMASAAFIIAFFLLKPVLGVWLGEEYVFLSKYILITFSVFAFSLTDSPAHNILKGIGKLNVVLLSSILGHGILPILISILGYYYLQNGYWAITLGLTISYVVRSIIQLIFCVKVVQCPLREFVFKSYGEVFIVVAPFLTLCAITVEYFGIKDILPLCFITILTLLLSAVAFYYTFFSTEEKQLYRLISSRLFNVSLAAKK